LDSKRSRCERCLRAQRACICAWIHPVAHSPEVLILQHPLEVNHAKGSARLLHLCLTRSLMLVGETFDDAQLSDALYADGRQPVLLYPDTPELREAGVASAPSLTELDVHSPVHLRLVVIDATWRKSRKMLYLNAQLQTLPRLSLRDMPDSQYRIRKAHRADQLSTLEAGCYALQQLDVAHRERYENLLVAFDGFVSQQMQFVPT
jgi:DTW domain-containing protein